MNEQPYKLKFGNAVTNDNLQRINQKLKVVTYFEFFYYYERR